MIIETLPNITPYNYFAGLATKLDGDNIPKFEADPTSELCPCGTGHCEYTELVFADSGDASDHKNDHTDLLFRKFRASDTVTIQLFKADVLVATITNDTLGEFFSAIGPDGLYVGFYADWRLIQAAFGSGRYQFKAPQSITGNVFTFESRKFKLEPYRESQANGTIRIDAVQNGNIIGNTFDYTGLNWRQTYRIGGKFGNEQPALQIDKYQDEVFKDQQIQDQVLLEYTLETLQLPSVIADKLTKDSILANTFEITDYNVINKGVRYRRISLYPSDIDSPTQQGFTQNYNIIFTPKKQDLIKRNF